MTTITEFETRLFELRFTDDDTRMSPGILSGVIMPYEERAIDRPEMFAQDSLEWPSSLKAALCFAHSMTGSNP